VAKICNERAGEGLAAAATITFALAGQAVKKMFRCWLFRAAGGIESGREA
jgi:hypothetical protein